MRFSKAPDATTAPEVVKIASNLSWSLLRSKIPTETSHAVAPSLEAGPPIAESNLAYEWKFRKTEEKTNSARIIGATRTLGPDKSRKNSAIWVLVENPDTDSGIPSFLQTVVP
ncbi:hypothetical protein DL769_011717 [Monosporascus sp. CRB-8-3]|nr:hypothetical protein DL769_011717 [Monosporascus sp. CRB-8-3]